MLSFRGMVRSVASLAVCGGMCAVAMNGWSQVGPGPDKVGVTRLHTSGNGAEAREAERGDTAKDAVAATPVTNACVPKILGDTMVASAEQRKAAGAKAWPPLTDIPDGFAWPDTPLGVIQGDGGYVFFGSDGGYHAKQMWEGLEFGNNKYGSITRTIGTLDNPLGTEPPIDVTIQPNPDPSVNPFYSSYDYMGGGPVWRVPAGTMVNGKDVGGSLLMVYHAEIPTVSTQSFDSVYALAASTNGGMSWMDLGEIIRTNQGYRTDMDGFDIGDAPLVISPDGLSFYIYFRDWLANGTTHWGNTITEFSMARASISSVVNDAFGVHPRAAAFQKLYDNFHLDQGLGGYSEDLKPNAEYSGELQVAWSSYLKRYQAIIGEGVVVAYAESPDGLHWSLPVLLYDFRTQPDMPSTYVMPVGMTGDPRVLGKEFYVFYTRYPQNGGGWDAATVHRATLSCQ